MKRFFVCFAVFAAMVFIVGCGGSDNNSSGGSSVSSTCSYGDYECRGNDSYFCGYYNNDLIWVRSETCEYGCDYYSGRCSSGSNSGSGDNGNTQENACNNGDYRCSGNARLQCQNNSWEFAETCENGCDASTGYCNTKSSGNDENVDSEENENTVICNENEYECSGNQKMKCKDNDWTVAETCANGCENKECLETQPDTCTDGSLKCSDDGSTVMICKNNDWGEHETCLISCNSKKNKCVECSSGNKCNGDMLLTCSDGEWTFKETCSLGCSNDKCNVCTPNCTNKQCGLDGCGGTCGSCDDGYDCTATSQCVKNNLCSEHNDCSGDDICYKNFCQSPWNKKWKITFKDAKVSEKDQNNESWDAFGGLPDLFSIIFVNDNLRYRTTTKQDSTTAVWNESSTLDFAASTDTIKLCLYDEDFTSSITGDTVDSNDLVSCLIFDSVFFRKFDETNKFFTFSTTSSDLVQYWRIAFEPAW
ncbi:hypothetical protein J5834_06080 [bacterium]|nr:hypothetical protein [bacterium]